MTQAQYPTGTIVQRVDPHIDDLPNMGIVLESDSCGDLWVQWQTSDFPEYTRRLDVTVDETARRYYSEHPEALPAVLSPTRDYWVGAE